MTSRTGPTRQPSPSPGARPAAAATGHLSPRTPRDLAPAPPRALSLSLSSPAPRDLSPRTPHSRAPATPHSRSPAALCDLSPRTPRTHLRATACLCALALALALACGPGEPTPTATAEAYVAAIQRGDTRALLPLLDGRARARLAAAAERASDQVGGRRTIAPHEMLQVVDLDPTLQVARVELLDGDETVARVRVHGSQGQTIDLDLTHEEGAWRVRAPLPPSSPP